MIDRTELAEVKIFYFVLSEFETSPQKDENLASRTCGAPLKVLVGPL